jgi:hypothetical protein
MKQSLLILFLFISLIGIGQTKKPDGAIQLFNGKDLKGWKVLGGKAKYEVKNGEIIGTTVSKEPNSFLVTEETFGDFILTLEFKNESGHKFREFSLEVKANLIIRTEEFTDISWRSILLHAPGQVEFMMKHVDCGSTRWNIIQRLRKP